MAPSEEDKALLLQNACFFSVIALQSKVVVIMGVLGTKMSAMGISVRFFFFFFFEKQKLQKN